jgi:hypothetical protein
VKRGCEEAKEHGEQEAEEEEDHDGKRMGTRTKRRTNKTKRCERSEGCGGRGNMSRPSTKNL